MASRKSSNAITASSAKRIRVHLPLRRGRTSNSNHSSSTWCRKMFERPGEITPPCGEPTLRTRSPTGRPRNFYTLAASVALAHMRVPSCLLAASSRAGRRSVPAPMGSGLSKSAASRRFVALSAARMKEWVASDLSGLDLLVIQIDGIHMDEDLILVAAIGVDAKGDKHPLGLIGGRRRTPRPSRRSSIISSSAGSIRRCRGCSSSTARRPCPRRSPDLRSCRGDPALSGPQGSQHYGAITQIRYTLRSGVCCDKHGNLTMPTRPKSCSATSPNVSNETGPGSPARSWKASTRSSPSRGLDGRRSCGARSPAPTLSRT